VLVDEYPNNKTGNLDAISTDPKEIMSEILEERDVKVLIINGDLDFHTNYFGTEKLVSSFEWYG